MKERIASTILNGTALGLLLFAAFAVSPYTGFAAVVVIMIFLFKK